MQRPNLTVLQLRAAAGALSSLDAAAQLAAAALLLRGGFWAAAVALGFGGDWGLVGEVLGEVAALLRAGLALGDDDEVCACVRGQGFLGGCGLQEGMGLSWARADPEQLHRGPGPRQAR